MTDLRRGPLIDISVPVSVETPRWPGSPAFESSRWLDLDRGDVATDTTVRFSVHLGTHIDAPSHFVRNGITVESISLNALVGRCWVVEISKGGAIGPDELAAAWPQEPVERVLLRTPNSGLWSAAGSRFVHNFAGVSGQGAAWLVQRGVRLIGVDYLSIQRFEDPPDTHLRLLEAGVVILEGLNLSSVEAGPYELICLPMRMQGLEAAPARAVLRRLSDSPRDAELDGRSRRPDSPSDS